MKDQTDQINNHEEKDSNTDVDLREEHLSTDNVDDAVARIHEISSNESIEYEKALDLLDKLLMVNPDDPKVYYEKGFFFEIAQRYHDAIKCFDQALNINRDYF